MLSLIAEGTSHSAAPGIQIDRFATGNSRQQTLNRPRSNQRFLMAMSVQQNALGTGLERQSGLACPFFEREARFRHPPRILLQFATE